MITEERIQEALDCFKQPGTDQERRDAAKAVILNAVDDKPSSIGEMAAERLTENEARLIASLVEGNINRITLDLPTLDAFWIKIKDPSDDGASASKEYHRHTGLPLEMCDALYGQFHAISDEVGTGMDAFYDKRIVEIQRKHDEEIEQSRAEIDQRQQSWQIEHNMVLAWMDRVKRLRRSLLRMAESPHYCDACGANALGPEPNLNDVLQQDIPF